MTQRFVNNFGTTLAATLGASDTFMGVASTDGLPSLGPGEFCLLTLYRGYGIEESGYEVVKVTAIAPKQLTVERAYEGAAPSLFLAGTRVEARNTARSMEAKLDKNVGDAIANSIAILRSDVAKIAAATGDTLTTARALVAPDWLRCDGSDYLASSYPGLAELLGPASIFSKLPDPAVVPPSAGLCVAYTADGVYLAVGYTVTPFISVYKLTAGVYVKLAALTAAAGGVPLCVTFSPDGRYLFIISYSTPYGHLYERTGDTFAKLTLPSGLTGSVIGSTSAAFSPDGTMLAIPDFRGEGKVNIHSTSGNWTVATTVASLNGDGLAQSVAFSPDGTHLMASFSATTPFLQGWERSGNTFPNRLTITSQPANYATNMSYSSDSKYLALSLATYPTGYGSPGYSVHSRVGNSYTKLPVPQIAADSVGRGVSFSPDTGQLAVMRQTAPYLTVLRRNGDQFTVRTDMPSIPIIGLTGTQGAAFNPTNNDLAITALTTPFMYVLRNTVDPTKTRVPNLRTDDSLVNTYIKT